jgi:hypothetical protein
MKIRLAARSTMLAAALAFSVMLPSRASAMVCTTTTTVTTYYVFGYEVYRTESDTTVCHSVQ